MIKNQEKLSRKPTHLFFSPVGNYRPVINLISWTTSYNNREKNNYCDLVLKNLKRLLETVSCENKTNDLKIILAFRMSNDGSMLQNFLKCPEILNILPSFELCLDLS